MYTQVEVGDAFIIVAFGLLHIINIVMGGVGELNTETSALYCDTLNTTSWKYSPLKAFYLYSI